VIDPKLEDAIAVGPHLLNMSKAGSNECAGCERKQGHGAKAPSLGTPAFEFPPVECHRYTSQAREDMPRTIRTFRKSDMRCPD
jgi:cytochrome c